MSASKTAACHAGPWIGIRVCACSCFKPSRQAEGAEPEADGLGSLTGLSLDQIEKQAIRNALSVHQGNREAAAHMLGIGERTLYRKLKEYGLK